MDRLDFSKDLNAFSYMYKNKNDNLLPYFLAHALADMVGTSFLSLFIG